MNDMQKIMFGQLARQADKAASDLLPIIEFSNLYKDEPVIADQEGSFVRVFEAMRALKQIAREIEAALEGRKEDGT